MDKTKIVSALFFWFFWGVSLISFGQSVPQGISYQAIARDATGQIYENTNVNVTIGILQDGNLVWEEIHSTITNQFGLITLVIGEGVSTNNGTLGDFNQIDWFDGSYSGQFGIEVDGEDFIDLGTTIFLTVPYAFHAQTVENSDDADADPGNELISNAILDSDVLIITENGVDHEVDFSVLSQDDDWDTNGSIVSNVTSSIGVATANPTSIFHANASMSYGIISIDQNQNGMTLGEDHHIVIGDVQNSSITINLPDAITCEGREYIIKAKSDGGGNTITLVTLPDQKIDVNLDTLTLQGSSMRYVTLVSDGANWWIIGGDY